MDPHLIHLSGKRLINLTETSPSVFNQTSGVGDLWEKNDGFSWKRRRNTKKPKPMPKTFLSKLTYLRNPLRSLAIKRPKKGIRTGDFHANDCAVALMASPWTCQRHTACKSGPNLRGSRGVSPHHKQTYLQMAVAQKPGIPKWNPGKWKQRPKPA